MQSEKRRMARWFCAAAFCFFAVAAAVFGLLCGEASAFSVTLGWDPNTESNLAGYKIYYDTDSGAPYRYSINVPLSSPNFDRYNPEYTVSELMDGAVYYFALTAYNDVGLESGYSNEVSTGKANLPPILSTLEVNGVSGSTTIYTNAQDRKVNIRIVASDDTMVNQYLILDGISNPAGRTFHPIPEGPQQNPIFTVSDFTLNNADGSHTVYAWVMDVQGAVSPAASKTNVILDRVPPAVALTFSSPGPYNNGQTVTVTANFTDANAISGIPKINIYYASAIGHVSDADMAPLSNKEWTYRMTIPPGSDGTATIRITAFDAAGNPAADPPANTFAVGGPSPSVVGFPTINTIEGSITVTYSEGNMQNAALASNYSFDNGLLVSGNGTDIGGMNKVFKLPLNLGTLQPYTLYTLYIGSDIKNSAGKGVAPNTIKINDDDNDGMADDWERRWFGSITAKNGTADSDGDGLIDRDEYHYARSNPLWGSNRWNLSPLNKDSDGDGIPDKYEILNGLNPVDASDRDLDLDQDGWTNYEEYTHGTAPDDPDSRPQPRDPIEIIEVLPLNNAGIAPDQTRIPNNTAFAVRMESMEGIDLSDPNAVIFNIADGRTTYPRSLNVPNSKGAKIVQAVPLDVEGNVAYSLWAVYYRSNETAISNAFPYEGTVRVTVNAKNVKGEAMKPLAFSFKIQAREEDDAAQYEMPVTSIKVDNLFMKKTIRVDAGPSEGASITYDSTLLGDIGIEPYFGPSEEIPPLTLAEAVGAPLNLLPPAVFPKGVVINIPCPGYGDVSELSVYYYDGGSWVMACGPAGNVLPEGEGWMMPGSRVNRSQGNPSTIEIKVYHFSAVAAGGAPAPMADGGVPAPNSTSTFGGSAGGGGCFISTLCDSDY